MRVGEQRVVVSAVVVDRAGVEVHEQKEVEPCHGWYWSSLGPRHGLLFSILGCVRVSLGSRPHRFLGGHKGPEPGESKAEWKRL